MKQFAEVSIDRAEAKKAENELALKEFGSELKRLRRSRNLTQKQLNELTGIDKTVISDLENGNYTPSLVLIRELAEGLRISPYDLIAPYYGLPLPSSNLKDKLALEKIKDVISTYYHLELTEQVADELNTVRQRRRQAEVEEAEILAEITPDINPTTNTQQNIPQNQIDNSN